MWGNPTREREILLLCFRKVHINSKITFPAKDNTSQHQICPIEICLFFHAKTISLYSLLRTSFFVPTVSCTNCFVRPRNNHRKSEIRLENYAQNASISVPKSVQTVRIRTVRPPTTGKYFGQKLRKVFSGIVSSFLGERALFAAHFPLSSLLKKSL
jgi:hypothetical protein